jgi:hypothetical protein
MLTRDLVSRFEQHLADSVESLITHSLQVSGNPEGYALFREGMVRASLSTNPRATWATQTFGVAQQPAEALRRVVAFFDAHQVPARMRIIPGDFGESQAELPTDLGMRHVGFHTILWAPLPLPTESITEADIREVSTLHEMDTYIDIQLGAYGLPHEVIDRLRPLRRAWLGSSGRRLYLAYIDGRPVAQGTLFWREEIAYLESAGTLTAYRRRGLQRSLILRRIDDAIKLGCRLVIGGADFESPSRLNQMACGLSVAYTAAVWQQRSAPQGLLA